VGNGRGVSLPNRLGVSVNSQQDPRMHNPGRKSILMNFLVLKTLLMAAIFSGLVQESSVKIVARVK